MVLTVEGKPLTYHLLLAQVPRVRGAEPVSAIGPPTSPLMCSIVVLGGPVGPAPISVAMSQEPSDREGNLENEGKGKKNCYLSQPTD